MKRPAQFALAALVVASMAVLDAATAEPRASAATPVVGHCDLDVTNQVDAALCAIWGLTPNGANGGRMAQAPNGAMLP